MPYMITGAYYLISPLMITKKIILFNFKNMYIEYIIEVRIKHYTTLRII